MQSNDTLQPLESLRQFVAEAKGSFTPSMASEGSGVAAGTVRNFLRRMLERGELVQEGYGRYRRAEGGDDSTKAAEPVARYTSSEPDVVEVVMFDRVHSVSAGEGTLVVEGDDATAEAEWMPRWVLESLIGMRLPEKICVLRVEGDSMRKRNGGLHHGWPCIYTPSMMLTDGARHILSWEDRGGAWRVMVKRVQVLLGGGIRIMADNPDAGFISQTLLPVDDGDGDGGGYLVNQETGLRTRLYVVGDVLWPRETDEEATVRAVLSALEQFRRNGAI